MTDALRMDIGEGAKELVGVDLNLEDWHGGLHLVEEARGAIYRLRYKLKDEVEVYFLFLRPVSAVLSSCQG